VLERHGGRAARADSTVPSGSGVSRTALLFAWGVHAFTASGAVFGFLALLAISAGEWRIAFLWMAVTIAIDGCDGVLARRAAVKRVLPGFDGELLDNMVDYFTYVVVPAFFLYSAPILPAGWGIPAAAAVILASAYQFARADAKTEDHFFTGFPSYWNIVVFYLLVLELTAAASLGIVLVLCVLVFVPFRYAYPSRTPTLRPLTIALSLVWAGFALAALVAYPHGHQLPALVSLLYVPYYLFVSVWAQRPAGRGTPAPPE
jgi:phosphatidylcholine synthase